MSSLAENPNLLVERVWARPGPRWLLIAALWSLVGFLSAAHWHFFFLGEDPYTWWQLLRIKLLLWFMWGAFTLWILRIGRTFKPEGAAWKRNLLFLALSSVGVVLLYLALYTLAVHVHLGRPLALAPLRSMLGFVVWTHSTFYYLAFWTTIGIDYAFSYFKKYRERELKASRLEAELSHAQLQSLRSKLHPHFLFNALNTISSLVYEGERERAFDMIARLAELLRTSLKTDDAQFVPLEHEATFTEQYLEILRMRFPDRLTVSLDFAPDTLHAEVPGLLLQPLVENAVKHGMNGHGGPLTVGVVSLRDGNNLLLEIRDSGPGIRPDANSGNGAGFGLRSTRERLAMIYNGRHSFTIRREGDQTFARIIIPFSVPPTAVA